MLTSTETNSSIEPGILRLEQHKRRWLDRLATETLTEHRSKV